jgi:hypothetical protein
MVVIGTLLRVTRRIWIIAALVVASQAIAQESQPWVCDTIGVFVLPAKSDAMIRFAVIGDYGAEGRGLQAVAELVTGWSPDFIITVGDNNYPNGSAETIDQNVGQYFHGYIGDYQGDFGEGSEDNRFFPTMGNHDWDTDHGAAYLDYFDLPGNERYYDFTRGPVHFFALDSDLREPDDARPDSVQARWFQERAEESDAPFTIVYMHHPPYSSGRHGDNLWMEWDFADYGVTAVISGHDHLYERIVHNGVVYFVNGLGGITAYPFKGLIDGSEARYNCSFGAMLVDATEDAMTFNFVTVDNLLVDSVTLTSTSR